MAVQTTYVKPAVAFSGMLFDNSHAREVKALINEEASAEVPFGAAVKFGTNDKDALLPTAQADKIAGIVAHSHEHDKGTATADLGSTGLRPGVLMNIARRGKMWVTCASGCAPGDNLWVRRTAGAGEALGDLENAADSTDMIDETNHGTWLSTAVAGGLAELSFDFTGAAT